MATRTSSRNGSNPVAPRRIRSLLPFAWSMAGMLASVPLIFLALPQAAHAGGFLEESKPGNTDKPAYAVPAKRKPVEGEGTEAAEAELSNAKLRISEAIENAEAATYNLKRARNRRYPRGEALEVLRAGASDAQEERRSAERDFRSTLEKARREGVPAGTLMPYMDYADWLDQQAAAAAKDQ